MKLPLMDLILSLKLTRKSYHSNKNKRYKEQESNAKEKKSRKKN